MEHGEPDPLGVGISMHDWEVVARRALAGTSRGVDDARFHAFMRAGTSSRVCPRRDGSILRLLGRHEIALHVSFRVS